MGKACVESMVIFSEIIEDSLPGYKMSFQSPANPELILLTVSEGEVLYDFVED